MEWFVFEQDYEHIMSLLSIEFQRIYKQHELLFTIKYLNE